jgi:hypothetical protein
MRGRYARKTGIVTEEKNIVLVYRYGSAQMTGVSARVKRYPETNNRCFTPGLVIDR